MTGSWGRRLHILVPPGPHGSRELGPFRGPVGRGLGTLRTAAAHRLQEVGQFLPPVSALGRGQLVSLTPHSTALLLLRADLGGRGSSGVGPGPLAAWHSPGAGSSGRTLAEGMAARGRPHSAL